MMGISQKMRKALRKKEGVMNDFQSKLEILKLKNAIKEIKNELLEYNIVQIQIGKSVKDEFIYRYKQLPLEWETIYTQKYSYNPSKDLENDFFYEKVVNSFFKTLQNYTTQNLSCFYLWRGCIHIEIQTETKTFHSLQQYFLTHKVEEILIYLKSSKIQLDLIKTEYEYKIEILEETKTITNI